MQNSQLVVEGVEVVEVVEGVEVVEVVEVVEGVEEWLNLLFFIFHSSFFICIGCSLVPCPLSLVPGCFLQGTLNFVSNSIF